MPDEEKVVFNEYALIEGIETIEDVAFVFCKEGEAETHGLLETWRTARRLAQGGALALQEVLKEARERNGSSGSGRIAGAPACARHTPNAAPPPRGPATGTQGAEYEARRAAALVFIKLSRALGSEGS